MTLADLVPSGSIERRILVARGHKVILDADLAALYSVLTGRLNEQVKRNRTRTKKGERAGTVPTPSTSGKAALQAGEGV